MGAARVQCPTCKRGVDWTPESQWRPFCSERCRLVDLGAWFTDGRSIPGDADAPQEDPQAQDSPPRD